MLGKCIGNRNSQLGLQSLAIKGLVVCNCCYQPSQRHLSVYSTSKEWNCLVLKYIFILTASSEISTTIVPTAADVTLSEPSEITKLTQDSVLTPSLISLSRESSQQFNKKVIYREKCYNGRLMNISLKLFNSFCHCIG